MLRFTRRQYETVLRRGGVPESGLAFEDRAQLVALVDDFRALLPEPAIRHAYSVNNQPGVAGEFGMLELTSPPGGMWVQSFQMIGHSARWMYGLGIGATLINTPGLPAAARQIRDDVGPTLAVLDTGAAAAYTLTLAIQEYPLAVEIAQGFPLYVPTGRYFFAMNATANEQVFPIIRWTEPGI